MSEHGADGNVSWQNETRVTFEVVPARRDAAEAVMLAHWAPLNVVDGVPHCRCCDDPMVEVEPGRWMCQLGAAVQKMLAEAMGKLT